MDQANKYELFKKIDSLYDQGDFAQALSIVEELFVTDGETPLLLDYQFDLFMHVKEYEKAKATALRLEEISTRKTPWNCLKIAEACLANDQLEEAYTWLEKAILDRHFKRIDVFDSPAYESIRKEVRFIKLFESSRENIMLGQPAIDFTVPLLDGSELTLSLLKGQVVLLDFWKVDCPPCIREIPNLKDLYAEFKGQGFEIVSISLDSPIVVAEKYAAEHNLQWKTYCSGNGFLDKIAVQYTVEATPSAWLIDPQGVLRFFDLRGSALRDAVCQLINEGQPSTKCRGGYCTL